MSTPQVIPRMTAEEFLEWETTQIEKHEFMHGLVYQVYAIVGACDAHVTVVLNFASLLYAFAGEDEVELASVNFHTPLATIFEDVDR